MSSECKIENPTDESVEVHKLACCIFFTVTWKLFIIEEVPSLALNKPEVAPSGIRCLKAFQRMTDNKKLISVCCNCKKFAPIDGIVQH